MIRTGNNVSVRKTEKAASSHMKVKRIADYKSELLQNLVNKKDGKESLEDVLNKMSEPDSN
jgi:hypothetical protein